MISSCLAAYCLNQNVICCHKIQALLRCGGLSVSMASRPMLEKHKLLVRFPVLNGSKARGQINMDHLFWQVKMSLCRVNTPN